ncbi:MAG TPA: serine hydrolase, partial [candidate division Zixibacteria bacterium]|nr:serine hydrolase [candidate division Zixibacteria bacterium]
SLSTIEPAADTPTPTQPDSDLIPCGVVLPIVNNDGEQPTSKLSQSKVDFDSVPPSAQAALRRILQDPDSVGLVAFELGNEDQGIYFNADTPMPLASLTKIINLVAYAEAADRGDIDPSEWIPVSELERTYLPGSDLGAHRASLRELEEKGLISAGDPALPMEQIPWIMMRHSSNAASDFLHMLIGQEKIENTVLDLGLATHSAPCPFIGQFLAISNDARSGNDQLIVSGYMDDPEIYGREVMQLTDSFMNDPEFRRAEGNWRAPVSLQRTFASNLNSKASARDYANLMSKIIQNEIGSDYVNILVRRAIEWPMIYPVNQQLYSSIGYKNGSFPGVLNIAYYGQRIEDGAQVVVILMFRDLPMQMYRQWRENLTHDELARWLLSDPTAIDNARAWIED